MLNIDFLLRRFGLSQAFEHSAVQYNSIAFRIVIGVLSDELRAAVAIVTTIEFLLNSVFEIPGGWISDRIGRFKSLAVGNVLIILAYTSMFIAFLIQHQYSQLAIGLVVLDGILLGVGKPFISGSLEAFYQHAIDRLEIDKEKKSKSLTQASRYGKWIPPLVAIFSFPLIFYLWKNNGLATCLFLGIVWRAWILIRIRRDFKIIGDVDVYTEKPLPTSKLIKKFFALDSLRAAAILYIVFFLCAASVLGYLIVSLGNKESQQLFSVFNIPYEWIGMTAFMTGFMSLGWLGHSSINPWLIDKMTERNYLFFYMLMLALVSLVLNYLSHSNPEIFILFLFVYGAIFAWASQAIRSVAINKTMAQFYRADLATALSVLNIPAGIMVGAHSLFILHFFNGIPPLRFVFGSVCVFILIGLLLLALTKSLSGLNRK